MEVMSFILVLWGALLVLETFVIAMPPHMEPATIEEQCQSGASIIPHPTECHQYYNCSLVYTHIPRGFEQHLKKCPYPELFSVESRQCEPFEKVKCGKRIERVDGCDYLNYMCDLQYCIPCELSMPSCKGNPDGMNTREQFLWTSFFVVCYKSRLVGLETCPNDESGGLNIFHPLEKRCVPLDQVPQEHGGTMTDCSGNADGFYPDNLGRCDQYTECQDGKVLNILKCSAGKTFDVVNKTCLDTADACIPCGKKKRC